MLPWCSVLDPRIWVVKERQTLSQGFQNHACVAGLLKAWYILRDTSLEATMISIVLISDNDHACRW